MRSLSEHFNEMNIKFNKKFGLEEGTIIHQTLNSIAVEKLQIKLQDKLQDKLHKGGDLVDKNTLLQCEDEIKEFTIYNKKYKICVRNIKHSKNQEEYYIINFYSKDTKCVILEVNNKKKEAILRELLNQEGCSMKEKNNLYEDINTGEVLMEIIIKICKKLNMEKISLSDYSHIFCKSDTEYFRINLITSKMMLDGETWYGKFGFIAYDKDSKKKYIENQNNYKKVLTSNISFDKIIKGIGDKEKYKKEIKELKRKYEEMKNLNLSEYMRWISINYCSIYYQIYEYIYLEAGYKKYLSLKFELDLQPTINYDDFIKMINKK
jgi:hypothetical protein